MTVTASPADVPAGTPTRAPQGAIGKGQSLLNEIAAIQALVTAAKNPATQPDLVTRLNRLQIQAVDYFMGSYWVSADSILAATYPAEFILPHSGDPYVTAKLAAIAARVAQINNPGTVGIQDRPPGGTAPSKANSQYSVSYPAPISGYPLTEPETVWYQLQTQLIDYCMNKGILPAATILSFMTGAQTYPWNGYQSDYTSYQQYWDGVY